jgi:hypothetical protein
VQRADDRHGCIEQVDVEEGRADALVDPPGQLPLPARSRLGMRAIPARRRRRERAARDGAGEGE